MDVFDALPNAIVSDVWQLGERVQDTENGKRFLPLGTWDVIMSETVSGMQDRSPNADYLTNATLLYVRPEVMEGSSAAEMVASRLWHNTETEQFFEILTVRIGKNQETGIVEHVEFTLKQVEIVDE